MHTTIEINEFPSRMSVYSRAGRYYMSDHDKESPLPAVRLLHKDHIPDQKVLKQYRKICQIPVSPNLPLTYPQMLAFPLHVELMLNEDFPYPLMGQVHVGNTITQHQPIGNGEPLTIECYFGDLETVAKGKQFDIITEVSVRGQLVWEARSTMIYRCKTSVEAPEKKHSELPYLENQVAWKIPENMGRRFGAISGDQNPIHMRKYLAKGFGFRTLIAHGMWTKARCLGALDALLPGSPLTISTDFKLPIFIPNTVLFEYSERSDHIEFMVTGKDGLKPHLAGTVRPYV